MVTELTPPVQLYLIVQVTLGAPVVHATTLCAPLVTHGVVETVISLVRLLIGNSTCLRINPLELWIIIQVGNTTTILTEHVIPGDHTTKCQTLGDEVELLLQDEVGIDTGRSNGLHTTDRRGLSRVTNVSRTRQVTP